MRYPCSTVSCEPGATSPRALRCQASPRALRCQARGPAALPVAGSSQIPTVGLKKRAGRGGWRDWVEAKEVATLSADGLELLQECGRIRASTVDGGTTRGLHQQMWCACRHDLRPCRTGAKTSITIAATRPHAKPLAASVVRFESKRRLRPGPERQRRGSRLDRSGYPEAESVEPDIDIAPDAEGRADEFALVAPGATADDTVAWIAAPEPC
jgi:hypothetical protein